MHKVGGKLILWGLIIALLIFTALRTLHFLQMTFPPDLAYVAYLGLAAFDIGILGWLYYATNSAEGAVQRALAYGMVFICAGGVAITTVADMIIVSSQNGLTKLPPQWGTIGLWGVMIVIILNVLAGVLVHLNDPRHKRHLAMENARDKIHRTVLTHIDTEADRIAPQIAQHAARHWANQTIQEMIGSIPEAYNAPALPAAKVVDSTPPPKQKAASPDARVDPYGVKKQVDSEKKKKPLIDFSLPKGVSSKMTQKIDTAVAAPEEEEEIEEPDYGEPELNIPMDQAWQEHTSLNEQEIEIPKRKGKGGKKPGKVTRREVLGMENQEE